METETILIVGATGRIGVSAVIAALNTNRHVLAVARNQASAERMFRHVGTREGITTIEADVLSEDGVKSVVEKVERGELPAFQHVFSCVGKIYPLFPLQSINTSTYRECMGINLTANLYTYNATIPHLLSLSPKKTTYTQITGASADPGLMSITGISQGGLISLVNAAILENKGTNVRINEVYLSFLVVFEEEEEAGKVGVSFIGSRRFARVL